MAWVERRITRTSQPQDAVGIDWANPLTRGLRHALSPAHGCDLATGKPMVFVGSGLKSPGVFGVGALGNNASLGRVSTSSFGPEVTIVGVFNKITRTAATNLVFGLGATTGNQLLGLQLTSTSNNRVLLRNTNGGSAAITNFQPGGADSGVSAVFAAVFVDNTAANSRTFFNGQLATFDPQSSAAGSNSTFDTFAIGGILRSTAVYADAGTDGVLALAFNRALSDAENESLYANPWQIFEPEVIRIWVDDYVSAGGGATTISSDASTSYAIRAAIASDAAASYPVRAATSSDTTAAYPLRTATQSDTAAAYAIRSAASADALASYYVLGLVQSDTAGSYAVRAAAQSDALASYAVRSAVQSDALASYEILSAGVVFSDSPASYAIRAAVQADGAASYPVRSVAQADAAGTYAVRSAVWSDAGASYAVQGALVSVWADATASYFVDGVVASGVYPSQTTVLAGVQYGPTGVEYTGLLTVGSTGPTAAEIAATVRADLAAELLQLTKVAKLHGVGVDLVVTPTTRTAGTVVQTITTAGEAVTVSAA